MNLQKLQRSQGNAEALASNHSNDLLALKNSPLDEALFNEQFSQELNSQLNTQFNENDLLLAQVNPSKDKEGEIQNLLNQLNNDQEDRGEQKKLDNPQIQNLQQFDSFSDIKQFMQNDSMELDQDLSKNPILSLSKEGSKDLLKLNQTLLKKNSVDKQPNELNQADHLSILKPSDENTKTNRQNVLSSFNQSPLKNMEISQLKSQADSPVVQQLVSNDDFLLAKNQFSKKMISNPYNEKKNSKNSSSNPLFQGNQKIDSGNSLDHSLSELSSSSLEGSLEQPVMNSQEFILGQQIEKPSFGQVQKTMTMNMNGLKSGDVQEIFNQITDYVIQSKMAKDPTVQLKFNHDELGLVDITVSKMAQNQEAIAINIQSHALEGKSFFQHHQKELLGHLTQAGLNVADFSLDQSSQNSSSSKSDFDMGSQSQKNQQGQEKQFASEQNQRRHESDRRQELWKMFNKDAA